MSTYIPYASPVFMEYVFVSYESFQNVQCVTIFRKITLTLTLCQDDPTHFCILSLPPNFTFSLSCQHVKVPLGSSFVLEYKGQECEVRVGRRILITDLDTYISNNPILKI